MTLALIDTEAIEICSICITPKCGRAVFVKKRGLCRRCYNRDWGSRVGWTPKRCGVCGTTEGPLNSRGRCPECHRREVAEWRAVNPTKTKKSARRSALALYWRRKLRIFAALGGQCVVCHESDMAFLVVDHIAGGGRAQRRILGGGTPGFYREVERSGPDVTLYAILCHNCNHRKSLSERAGTRKQCSCEYGDCPTCLRRAAARERAKASLSKLRYQVITALGATCACCHMSDFAVLTVDHIWGDGAEHRRVVGAGSGVYRAVLKSGPDQSRYQILCHNCNFAKSHTKGGCPHGR